MGPSFSCASKVRRVGLRYRNSRTAQRALVGIGTGVLLPSIAFLQNHEIDLQLTSGNVLSTSRRIQRGAGDQHSSTNEMKLDEKGAIPRSAAMAC